MPCVERKDDFEARRAHLKSLSDDELHDHFWRLVDNLVAPLIDEARSHTTPSIERSVLLRMGFSSIECRQLVTRMQENGLLKHGAGRMLLQLAKRKGISIRDAGEALLANRYWEELPL